MRKERKIIIIASCFVFLEIPVAFLIVVYGIIGLSFMLYLPLLLMSIVLIYGALDVRRLVANGEREEAGSLIVILLAFLLIGFIIFVLGLNIVNNYSGYYYPPGTL